MKKFTFRLQVVLDIKEKLLEEKLLELAKVQRGLQEAVQKQKELEGYQLEINNALLRVFQSGNDLDLNEVQRYKDFFNNTHFSHFLCKFLSIAVHEATSGHAVRTIYGLQ